MKNKYFIAIVLKEIVLEKAEQIKLELKDEYGLKGALRSPSHITLHRPFEWKEEKEQKLIDHLQNFAQPQTFEIKLKDFGCFEPRVIYVNVTSNAELTALHSKLAVFARTHLQLFNEVNDERGFHPHVTIAFRDLKKAAFPTLWDQYKCRSFEASFNYSGFSLLKLDGNWKILKTFDI